MPLDSLRQLCFFFGCQPLLNTFFALSMAAAIKRYMLPVRGYGQLGAQSELYAWRYFGAVRMSNYGDDDG
jgi:hypothetical protein